MRKDGRWTVDEHRGPLRRGRPGADADPRRARRTRSRREARRQAEPVAARCETAVRLGVWKGRAVRSRSSPATHEATFLPELRDARARRCGTAATSTSRGRATLDEFRAGTHDRGPARAPLGQPARGAAATAPAGARSTCAGSTSRPIRTACRSTATCVGAPFEIVHADTNRRRRLVARLDYGARPDLLARVPVPARRHRRRAGSTSAGCGSPPRSSRPGRPRCRSRSAGTRTCSSPARRSASWELRWPACERVLVDERVIPTGERVAQPRRARAARDAARSTITTRSAPTAASRSRPAAARSSCASGRRTRSGSCTCRRAANFAAIEPMTATIDALGRGTAPLVAAGRPLPRVVHDRGVGRVTLPPAARSARTPASSASSACPTTSTG